MIARPVSAIKRNKAMAPKVQAKAVSHNTPYTVSAQWLYQFTSHVRC